MQHFLKINSVFIIILLFGILKVSAQPNADFYLDKSSGCSPLVVNFTNKSTGRVASYFWRFGNNNTSTKKNPGAIFYQPGNYSITLIITDSNNVMDSITKTAAVTVLGAPHADFTVDTAIGCAPLKINFKDNSTPGTATIIKRTWDLGDGTVSKKTNPIHTYSSSGKFNISLVVEDNNGCKDVITRKNFISVNNSPKAGFYSPSPFGCNAPKKITFVDTSKNNSPGNLKRIWSFGDTSSSSLKNPSHTFKRKGLFTVSLKISDTFNCSDSITRKDYVFIGKEKAGFNILNDSGCAPLNVKFINTSAPRSSGSQYFWDFGDGNTSSDPSPTHIYLDSGTFDVKLIVTNPAGCKDSFLQKTAIYVSPNPKVKILVNDSTTCKPPFKTTFLAKSKKAVNFSWSFGNGKSSNSTEDSTIYNSYGEYDVSLIAVSANGCSTSVTKNKLIRIQKPRASFTVDTIRGCIPLTTNFKDKSESADPIVKLIYDFGDTTFGRTSDTAKTYTKEGVYFPKLKIITRDGCVDSISGVRIQAGTPPSPAFSGTPRVGCIQDMKVDFINLTNQNLPAADSFIWHLSSKNIIHTNKDTAVSERFRKKPGKYDIMLIALNKGCADTADSVDYLEITPPFSKFRHKFVDCIEDSVIFIDSSIGAHTYLWNFGDGDTSILPEPAHRFDTLKPYIISLIVTDTISLCVDTAIDTIYIPEAYKIEFTANQRQGCYPLNVTFFASANDSSSFSWDFGNGDTSANMSELVNYLSPGTYDVSLLAVSKKGCVRSLTKPEYIKTLGAVPKSKVSVNAGCSPLQTHLIDLSPDIDNQVKFWLINNTDTVPATQDTIPFTFQYPPFNQEVGHQVRFRIIDSSGCIHDNIHYVKALKPRPKIQITRVPTCDSVTFIFEAPINNSITVSPFNLHWTFGDFQKSTALKNSLTFDTSAAFRVKLVITDTFGCKDSTFRDFDFKTRYPAAGFIGDTIYKECPPLSVDLFDTSHLGYVGIKKWEWDFGDSSSSTRQNPQKLYIEPGKFTISLKITDSIGCSSTVKMPDYIVIEGPLGDFSFDNISGCLPMVVNFKSKTTNAALVQWDLGDGNLRAGMDLTHVYAESGDFTPLMIVTDFYGCTRVIGPKGKIQVKETPVSGFSFQSPCFGAPTVFSDTSSTRVGTIISRDWSFGDGGFSNLEKPYHSFSKPGFYPVSLTVTNSLGCSATLKRKIKIGGLDAGFTTKNPIGCVGFNHAFFDTSNADTTISSFTWIINSLDTIKQQNPVYNFLTEGKHNIKLLVEDVAGCKDQEEKIKFITITDTLPPAPLKIFYSSVSYPNPEGTISLAFEKYSKVNFKRYIIYRKNNMGVFAPIDSVYSANDTVYFDSFSTQINSPFCYKVQIETICKVASPLMESREHCTMHLLVQPGTNENNLIWTPYVGWDSISSYQIIRQNVTKEFPPVLIGEVEGGVTTFNDAEIICGKKYEYLVIAYEFLSSFRSLSDSAAAKPFYVPDVTPPVMVKASVFQDSLIEVHWKKPSDTKIRNFVMEKSENNGAYEKAGILDKDQNAFTDFKVRVNQYSYTYRINVIDSCGDPSPYSTIGKTILLNTEYSENLFPKLEWTPYQNWPEGVNYYQVEIKDENGNFNLIRTTENSSVINFVDSFTNLNDLSQYCYRITAVKNSDPTVTSLSNTSCIGGKSFVFVPNAFSPNGDGKNDLFRVKGTYLEFFHLRIYNSWGDRVFETDDVDRSWNGELKGEKLPDDIYIYYLKARGIDGRMYNLRGNISLLK